MRRLVLGVLALSIALAVTALRAEAAEPGPGKTTTVTCKDAPSQRYACYVPPKYTPKKAWPILYCFAPDANGQLFVQQYKKACEARGWIVVGSLNSKNGPWEPIQASIDAIWADTEARFSLSKTRRYASGFSGGARVSFALAGLKPEHFAGVIAIGAGLSSHGKATKKELACFLMCGHTCFNKPELDKLAPQLKEAGNPVHYENYPGAHVMPAQALMTQAIEWMDDQAVETRRERLREGVAEARARLADGKATEAWIGLIATLEALPSVKKGRKDAEKLRKTLEKDPEVKLEVKAKKEYAKAQAFLEKNAEKIRRFESKRKEAKKKLQRIVDQWPDTQAGQAAKTRLEELTALDTE